VPEPAGQTRSLMVSPALAGQINRGRVLRTLYANGPLARPELARLTGSTRATIGQIVQPLLEEGLLEEREPMASGSQGGKPPRPVWFSDHGWPVGAVMLLPGGAQAALVTAGGSIVATAQARFTGRRTDHGEVVEKVTSILAEVNAHATAPVRGVGIAVGGMIDTETGDVVRVDLAPAFNGLRLGSLVSAALGVPVFVDNQPRAQVLGDSLFGPGRGEDTFCSVYIGEGIGAGYMLAGVLHRGARGSGGEVGHTTLDRSGPVCRCGLTGCWETLASLRWLRSEAERRGLPNPRAAGAARLVRLTRSGDPRVREAAAGLLADYSANIALGLINLQQTLGLGLFIVHGDPAGGDEAFRVAIEAEVRRRAFDHPGGQARVLLAEKDDWATVRGAAGIVLSRSLQVAF
jgi:predicted NBD/HSP70 family sugar kinase